jgi:DNA-binding CsgD family transcriptional regulator
VSDEAATLLAGVGGTMLPDALVTSARRLGQVARTVAVPGSVEAELDLEVGEQHLKAGLRLARAPFTPDRVVLVQLAPAADLMGRGTLATAVESAAKRYNLTPAEVAVLREVAAGASNREIAKRLFISPHTVRTHLMHIFPKMGVHTRTAALARLSEVAREAA